MKKLIFIFILLYSGLATISGQTEKLDHLFQDFEKSGRATSINIKKPMFSLLKSIDLNDDYLKKIKPILNQVEGIKMVVIPKATYPENLKSENIEIEKMNVQKVNRVNKALDELKFNELMSVNNDGTIMKFLAESEKDGFLENLVFNIDSREENIIFLLNGKMKTADVNRMINADSSVFVPLSTSNDAQNSDSYLSGEAREVADFSGIDVRTGVNVVFKQEKTKSVKVIADADKLKYIVTKVENGILNVYIDNKGEKNLKFKNLSVNISNPDLSVVKASSGGNFKAVNLVKATDLDAEATSGSSINGDFLVENDAKVTVTSGATIKTNLKADDISFVGTSGSSATLEGNADFAKFDVSSGASCKAEKLVTNTAEVESTSGSSLSVTTQKKLTARASSGGSIRYKGNPEIDSKISKISGGSLKQVN